jgi:glycosyltransferase involved in cell wall biosynthesis
VQPAICLIGIFPPAPSGQAWVNESYRQLLAASGAGVSVIDLSPRPGPLTLARRLSRFPRAAIGLVRLVYLVLRGRAKSVYVGVAGGYGQLYDIAFIATCRLASSRLFLHHDSYAYLERPKKMTSVLMNIAGSGAVHIVLCDDMARRLVGLYPSASETVVISNATNTEPPASQSTPRTRLKAIGFIGFLSRAKGVLEFLDVADQLCGSHPELRALLAGPIADPSLEPILTARLRHAPWVDYLGPVYGDDKSRFFTEVDVLIFPTRYINEADPKVVTEALAHGSVVVAVNRGCVTATLDGGGGVCIPETQDFVRTTTDVVLGWLLDARAFSAVSTQALENYRALRDRYDDRLANVVSAMVGGTHDKGP